MARRFRDDGPHDALFDVTHTTVHTGVIQGGTALNIVPQGMHASISSSAICPATIRRRCSPK